MSALLRPGIQRWLETHCESAAELSGGVVVAAGESAGTACTVAQWPAGGAFTGPLQAAAQSALQRARLVVLAPAMGAAGCGLHRVVALPLHDGDRLLGAVALALQADTAHGADAALRGLTQASAALGALLQGGAFAAVAAPRVPQGAAPGDGTVPRLDELQAALLAPPTLSDGAHALLALLAPLLGCERACLAVTRGRRLELVAHVGGTGTRHEPALLRRITEAMREALDQRGPVTCPSRAGEPARITLAHTDLHAATGHANGSWLLWPAPAAASGSGGPVGVLLIEHRGGEPLNARQQAACAAVAAAIGPLVAVRRRAERSLRWRLLALLRRCRAQLERFMPRRERSRKRAGATPH